MKTGYRSARKSAGIIFPSIILLAALATSCKKDSKFDDIKPSKPTPEWGTDITPQMQTVIETLDSISPIPLYTLTPEQARMQPGPADAVKIVMKRFNIPDPPRKVDTAGIEIPSGESLLHARIYTPKTGKSSYPLIVYYHGGGWVIATIDSYDASAQAIAEKTDAIVVSVEYRKGPEFKFPTAHLDAFNAYKWLIQNASTFKADSTKIALAGESAGGNMAVTVGMMARDSNIKQAAHILAVYPVANNDLNSPSYIKYANAKPLSKPLIQWFLSYYLNSIDESNSPLLALVKGNLANLPPVTIVNAEIDPLLSDGEALAAKLTEVGNGVDRKVYKGVTHEFFGMATVIPEAVDAQNYATNRLKASLH